MMFASSAASLIDDDVRRALAAVAGEGHGRRPGLGAAAVPGRRVDGRRGLSGRRRAAVHPAGHVFWHVLPKYLAPDPLTLFLFAVLLGTLYHRTHRGVPAMVAHAMLNATSLLLAVVAVGELKPEAPAKEEHRPFLR